jgi:hypothetical protein
MLKDFSEKKVNECRACYKKDVEPDNNRKVMSSVVKSAEVVVLYSPNELQYMTEEERNVLGFMFGQVLGHAPSQGTACFSKYILEFTLYSRFGIRLSKASQLPILHCTEVKANKATVGMCEKFNTPFIGDKVIVVGKKTIGHVLFSGISPPSMSVLHGRPVVRNDTTYLLFHGVEFFLSYLNMATYNDPVQVLSALNSKYIEQIKERSFFTLERWFNLDAPSIH